MAALNFTRQLGIVMPNELTTPITVIGLGGIGSYVIPTLAKMGCSDITGYDDDAVESHNLPNQFFRTSDVGVSKAEALAGIVKDFSGIAMKVISERFTGEQPLSGIVISGVDSMESRQTIWNSVKLKPQVRLYLDARMGGQIANLFTIRPCDPEDIRFYEGKLYSEDETHELSCTERSIVYTVTFIAGLIANQIRKFAKAEQLSPELIWDAQTLTFMTRKGQKLV